MKTFRTGTLPSDLKSFTRITRQNERKEGLHTFVALILMAAVFLLVMIAAVPPEPTRYPVGWEEVRG